MTVETRYMGYRYEVVICDTGINLSTWILVLASILGFRIYIMLWVRHSGIQYIWTLLGEGTHVNWTLVDLYRRSKF